VGETITLNTNANSSCTVIVNRTARIVAISAHAIMLEDAGNPAGGFTTDEYLSLAATFDTLIYPVHVANFGAPSDIDHNGKVVLLYSADVNRLTPAGAPGGTVSGFFFARDLYPKVASSRLGACAGSNEGEIMYLMVPDPGGTINGNVRAKELVARLTIGTLAHELQHMINASRRMHVNISATFPEAVWLDEALAHNAEQLIFYRAANLVPGQNISAPVINASPTVKDAYTRFEFENVERFRVFLAGTNYNWAFKSTVPGLPERGAATSFMDYAVDRLGGTHSDVWRALVAGPDTGMNNLAGVLEADPVNWMRDWAVALYADDVVPYTLQKYQIPSWTIRSIISSVGEHRVPFPLVPIVMQAGVASLADLEPGGSLHYRFGIPPGGQSRLRSTVNGADRKSFSVVLLRTL
jgi:hypothetical protein